MLCKLWFVSSVVHPSQSFVSRILERELCHSSYVVWILEHELCHAGSHAGLAYELCHVKSMWWFSFYNQRSPIVLCLILTNIVFCLAILFYWKMVSCLRESPSYMLRLDDTVFSSKYSVGQSYLWQTLILSYLSLVRTYFLNLGSNSDFIHFFNTKFGSDLKFFPIGYELASLLTSFVLDLASVRAYFLLFPVQLWLKTYRSALDSKAPESTSSISDQIFVSSSLSAALTRGGKYRRLGRPDSLGFYTFLGWAEKFRVAKYEAQPRLGRLSPLNFLLF